MANTNAAKKRMAQDRAKHMHNKALKSEVRTQLKKTIKLIHSNTDGIDTNYKNLVRLADKAVTKGVYHKNKAARIKSRIGKQIHALQISASSTDTAVAVEDAEALSSSE